MIGEVPDLWRRLDAVGLTSKQTGMDNIRGVCGCPTAGLSPHELFDASVAAPPDPVTPGLLDLLTVARLGTQPSIDAAEPSTPSAPGFAVAPTGGSRRLWVEVEA